MIVPSDNRSATGFCSSMVNPLPSTLEASSRALLSFSKNGYRYVLLKQIAKIALYEARSQADGGLRSYEVHIVRSMPERAIFGKIVPAGARLASNEDFGTWAWSYTSQELAENKFQELTMKA